MQKKITGVSCKQATGKSRRLRVIATPKVLIQRRWVWRTISNTAISITGSNTYNHLHEIEFTLITSLDSPTKIGAAQKYGKWCDASLFIKAFFACCIATSVGNPFARC